MHIIIGLPLVAALLYFWLIGHWFARVLAFLAFGAVLGFLGGLMTAQPHNNEGAIGGIIGIALAWPLASIPLYVQRRRDRNMDPTFKRLLREAEQRQSQLRLTMR